MCSYLDDLVIYGHNEVEHDVSLRAVLKRLDEFNVRINPKKCVFKQNSIPYLGYILCSEGIKPDNSRFDPVVKTKSPTSHPELKSLLGFLQYYSRFISNFASLAEPLFQIMSCKDFVWSSQAEKALRSVVQFIKSGPVLQGFQPGKETKLTSDASETGIGAILEQEGRPVICISRRLSPSEKGYAQTQKEALAVHWAVKRLHKFLYGHPFTIITDHKSLQYIFDHKASLNKSTSAMLSRWSISLGAYDYNI